MTISAALPALETSPARMLSMGRTYERGISCILFPSRPELQAKFLFAVGSDASRHHGRLRQAKTQLDATTDFTDWSYSRTPDPYFPYELRCSQLPNESILIHNFWQSHFHAI